LRRTVRLGDAELVPDPYLTDAWLLLVDGTQQSHVDLADPSRLTFEYTRLIGHVLDTLPPGPMRALHLGGGALTMPRYLAVTRPGSASTVIEIDDLLIDLVREALPWPRTQSIRVRAADARAALDGWSAASVDLIILDVFAGARTPGPLTTAEAFARAAEVLRPTGTLIANLADEAPLTYARRFIAGIDAAFADVTVLAEPAVLRGRRFGNLIAVGRPGPAGTLDLPALTRRCAAEAYPARVVHGPGLDSFLGTHRPFEDGSAPGSPQPPPEVFG
jgi:Spermine/spermidine synthase domain